MSHPEFVDFADESHPLLADEEWHQGSAPSPEIRIVDFASFVETQEESAEPLLGTQTETLLPADGMLLMYGDGGAGKTTLTIDAVSHLASGSRWLNIDVGRPVNTLLIENEGPRGKFRQMLAEKHASWNGHPPFSPNVTVLEEPWTRFTLRDPGHRQAVAEQVLEQETDLVVMGPLVTLGMVGGGTPDEVSEFEELLRLFRAAVGRAVALWIVHHENKAGDVSGAWERVPDTLVHVQAQGNGHTRLYWRKARWSSESHGTSVDLVWIDGRSFETVEKEARDPWAEMLEAFRNDDEWRTAKEAGKLISISENDAKKVLAELTRRGEMTYEHGPHGRHKNARCWKLNVCAESLAHTSADSDFPPGGGAPEHTPPPFRGEGVQRTSAGQVKKGALTPSAHDDIPF